MSQVDDTRLIPLTQGKYAIVDAEDYDRLIKFKWHAQKAWKTYCALRKRRAPDGRWVLVQMHGEIISAPDGYEIDHADRDGLNNTRRNLRLATHADNVRNSHHPKGVSGFRGVTLHKGRWEARINFNGKRIHIGDWYRSAEDAARAYDAKALELHGEFAVLNFPE